MRDRVRRNKLQLIHVIYGLKLATLKLVARCSLSILLGFCVFVFVTAALPFSPALADGTMELDPTSGQVGSTINYTLSGWTPNAYYYIWFDSNGNGSRDLGEPYRNRRLDSSGGDTYGLLVPQVPAEDYNVCFDLDRDGSVDASATFTIIGKLILVPTSGPPDTSVVASTSSNGFAASSSGYIWFDIDNNDVVDEDEPQAAVTTKANGTINTSDSISVPLVPAGTYSIKIDILPDGSVDASAPFTVNAAIFLDPDWGVMGTETVITVTGGGFTPNTYGWVWFDSISNGVRDEGEEPQIDVTTAGDGTIPDGTILTAPTLPPNTTKYVLADIPEGDTIEASASFSIPKTTTSLTVTKYDAYGDVVGTPVTVTWDWMRDNLPKYGDGVTHYYHQGPTFDNSSFDALWNPDENYNVDTRDYGAVKGTDVKDLCELIGGASPGDTINIVASDGFDKTFDYEDIYYPEPEQGRLIVCWDNATYGGDVPAYDTGMRLVFFADDSVNPWHWNVFGDWNMHETLPASRWHFYEDDDEGSLPSSSGLSVQYVYNIEIYEPNLVSCDASGNPKDDFNAGETVYVKGMGLAADTEYNIWIQDEPVLKKPLDDLDRPSGTYVFNASNDPSGGQETVTTDGDGDFAPLPIWSAVDVAGKYDIVADNQDTGTVGTFDTTDFIDKPGWEGFAVEVSEYISLTVIDNFDDNGVQFGEANPGENNRPADQTDTIGAVTIEVENETSSDVDVWVRGDNFEDDDEHLLDVTSVKYNDINDYDEENGAKTLTMSYADWYPVAAGQSTTTQVWYWISIEAGQPAGNYTSNFYYKAE